MNNLTYRSLMIGIPLLISSPLIFLAGGIIYIASLPRPTPVSIEGEVLRERLGALRERGSAGIIRSASGGDAENYTLTIRDKTSNIYTFDIKENYEHRVQLRVLSQHLEAGDKVRIDLYSKLVNNMGEAYSSDVHPLPKR